ncbi:hypothetical protein [Pseudomonas asplenii]|uniref:hypothetical protein n=1 Tax=Pseudomonas asplenii TaxID=53407 RepID=UPI002233F721|nr:hypothetical protein [Pseudomonas asplenii]UZE27135.1 hypothetical protein LOY63_17305 [Pseudomonas asplenii]
MKVSIKLRLSLKEDHYDVNLELPGTIPTAESPFLFGVDQFQLKAKNPDKPDEPDTIDDKTVDKLLQVAIGTGGQLYVAVKPPKSLIHAAGVDDVVKNLEVLVAEGNYDTDKHKFN